MVVIVIYKSCVRCGRVHDVNYICNVGKSKRKYKYIGGEERKIRNSTAWVYKSLEMRRRANFLCEVCKDEGVYNYDNLEVHHIEKLKDAPTKLLDDSNLITLCQFHHKLADKGMLEREYLQKLAKNRDEKLGY